MASKALNPYNNIHSSGTNKAPGINFHDFEKANNICRDAVAVIHVLNHRLRQYLINSINNKTRITVTQLCAELRLDHPVANYHLSILKKAGIVFTKRTGKLTFYAINSSYITSINNFVEIVVKSVTTNE